MEASHGTRCANQSTELCTMRKMRAVLAIKKHATRREDRAPRTLVVDNPVDCFFGPWRARFLVIHKQSGSLAIDPVSRSSQSIGSNWTRSRKCGEMSMQREHRRNPHKLGLFCDVADTRGCPE